LGELGTDRSEQQRTSDALTSGIVQYSAKIVSSKFNVQSDKSMKLRVIKWWNRPQIRQIRFRRR
jgi:hypothetical protein